MYHAYLGWQKLTVTKMSIMDGKIQLMQQPYLSETILFIFVIEITE